MQSVDPHIKESLASAIKALRDGDAARAEFICRDFLVVNRVEHELGTEGEAHQWGSVIEGDPSGKAKLLFHDEPESVVGRTA